MPLDGSNYYQPPQSPIIAVLTEGYRLIEENWFWGGNGGTPPMNAFCAVLAISRQNVFELTMPALGYIARAIYGYDDPIGIQPWNDAKNPDGSPARTKEEVLAVYDKAIALAVLDELAHAA